MNEYWEDHTDRVEEICPFKCLLDGKLFEICFDFWFLFFFFLFFCILDIYDFVYIFVFFYS